jgi:hypothetical protein
MQYEELLSQDFSELALRRSDAFFIYGLISQLLLQESKETDLDFVADLRIIYNIWYLLETLWFLAFPLERWLRRRRIVPTII